ncbi:ABC transporter ATP-binding protein [Candidatus Peregrinibacteria bacterium]|nr:ABC transporter ATP-binding protein [Candidatus Peregrinibacteria bacterium]
MLSITSLSAGYAAAPDVIKNIHIDVKEAEMVSIIGPNGAGKSTILRSIFGFTRVSSGSILFYGEECIGLKPQGIVRKGIGYVPQGRSVFPSMTVRENLEMGAFTLSNRVDVEHGFSSVYSQFPILFKKRNIMTRNLSGGEQQMVALGRALMLHPKLLLLDEPSIGLSPKITQEVFEKCRDICRSGTAILMVEQNAHMALEYSNRGYVLELGENRLEGSASSLLHDKKVAELYLGKSM